MTNNMENIVKQDQLETQRKQLQPKGMLSGDDCVVTRCKVKEDNALLEEQIKILKKDNFNMLKEIQTFEERLEKGLKPDEKENLVIKAMKSQEMQVQHKIIRELQDNNDALKEKLQEVHEQFDDYRNDQDRIMTSFEADRKIQEKVKIIKTLRDKRDQLLVENENLEVSRDKVQIQTQHLVDAHNELLAEYKTRRKKVEQLKMIDKDGIRLKPLKAQASKTKKRKWLPIGFIRRN